MVYFRFLIVTSFALLTSPQAMSCDICSEEIVITYDCTDDLLKEIDDVSQRSQGDRRLFDLSDCSKKQGRVASRGVIPQPGSGLRLKPTTVFLVRTDLVDCLRRKTEALNSAGPSGSLVKIEFSKKACGLE